MVGAHLELGPTSIVHTLEEYHPLPLAPSCIANISQQCSVTGVTHPGVGCPPTLLSLFKGCLALTRRRSDRRTFYMPPAQVQ